MILQTVASLSMSEGGVPRSVAGLATALWSHGREVTILAADASPQSRSVLAARPHRYLPVIEVGGCRYRFRGLSNQLQRIHGESSLTLVHDHGIWLPMHDDIATWSERNGIPRLVSVRGMLNPWALGRHRRRKQAAWLGYQRRGLATADAIHATSEAEFEAVRRAGLRQPVIILGNGIVVSEPQRRISPAGVGERTALFLSRLHPSKGLDLLVHAWRAASPKNWKLVIAGEGHDGYEHWLQREIDSLGLTASVILCGAADDQQKETLYGGSELFILPTRSENFGLVVAEALAAGLPVITTQAAPWSWLPERRAGWWVPVNVASLASAIQEATALGSQELAGMGRRGRSEVLGLFEWSSVVKQYEAAYDWLQGLASAPSCVRL
jgi:glycosyltransferase involved in cell wall biosynthesis